MIREWYAVIPGAVGDPIEDRIDLEDIERSVAEACESARASVAFRDQPHRVVRIVEVAIFLNPVR